jgi:Peptidase_C39 like family
MRILLILLLIATSVSALPVKTYLPVPFLCQAPYANWSQPWQDGCEEAAIIMAMRYVKGKPVSRKSGNRELLDQVRFQRRKYGGHFDLTAAQSVQLIKDYYNYNDVSVRYDITIEDIKDELAKGNIVITPMAGRELENPYYTPPGPLYHYMVFKGYDGRSGEFITNDPGTKRGRNYRYKYQAAYAAIHDWTGDKQTIASGRKAMIIVHLLDRY